METKTDRIFLKSYPRVLNSLNSEKPSLNFNALKRHQLFSTFTYEGVYSAFNS